MINLTTNIHWWYSIPWKSISVYLIPLISVLASYIVGRLQNSTSQRKAVQQKRYEQLYLPAIRDLLISGYWRIDPCNAHKSITKDFYPLLSNHLELMGKESAKAFINFEMPWFTYKIDLGELMESRSDPDGPRYKIPEADKEAYNIAFLKLINALLSESNQLSRKLKFPNLTETISEIFDPQMSKWLSSENQKQD